MTDKVKAVPAEFHSLTPYLIVKGAAKAMEFYKKAFGAIERFRMPGPGGKIMHAEIKIGDSILMLADECPEMGAVAPKGPVAMFLNLYVENCDVTVQNAVGAGAKLERPLEDQFYGDRSGLLVDPFGHRWCVSTHKEDLTPEQISERQMKKFGAPSK
jgi:PhnB protein